MNTRRLYTIEFLTNDNQHIVGPVQLLSFNTEIDVGFQEQMPRSIRFVASLWLNDLNESLYCLISNGLKINIKIRNALSMIGHIQGLRCTSIQWLADDLIDLDDTMAELSFLSFESADHQYTPIVIDQVMASYGCENSNYLSDWSRLGF